MNHKFDDLDQDEIKLIIVSSVDTDSSGCWNWLGNKTALGYGRRAIGPRGKSKAWLTHRLSYFAFFGKFDYTLNVNHKCHNPSCCNPEHLYVGTQAENMLDVAYTGSAKGPRPGAQGELHSKAKLTKEQVIKLRELHSQGANIKRYWEDNLKDVVTLATVYNAIHKSWRHI